MLDPASRHPLRLVTGHRQEVGLWMVDRLPDMQEVPGGFEAIGVARGDELIGGCLFTNFVRYEDGGAIQVWAAGEPGQWVSRRIISAMLGYPFVQLGCHRIWAMVAKRNRPSRKLLTDLGFRLEGVARQHFGRKKDAMSYGMLREECKWI